MALDVLGFCILRFFTIAFQRSIRTLRIRVGSARMPVRQNSKTLLPNRETSEHFTGNSGPGQNSIPSPVLRLLSGCWCQGLQKSHGIQDGKLEMLRAKSLVSNGPGGYNFFGQEGTSPKSVGFGGLVPAPCQSCFFPRID